MVAERRKLFCLNISLISNIFFTLFLIISWKREKEFRRNGLSCLNTTIYLRLQNLIQLVGASPCRLKPKNESLPKRTQSFIFTTLSKVIFPIILLRYLSLFCVSLFGRWRWLVTLAYFIIILSSYIKMFLWSTFKIVIISFVHRNL